jgi:hypothetical protein
MRKLPQRRALPLHTTLAQAADAMLQDPLNPKLAREQPVTLVIAAA